MKRMIALALACLTALALCACADKAEDTPADIPAADTQTVSVGDIAKPGIAADNGYSEEFAAEFVEYLEDVTENFHPGTAGSSLVRVRYTAELADLFAKYKPDPAQVTSQIEVYIYQALDEEGEEMFKEQLGSIAGGYEYLSTEDGKNMLEDSGYESAGYEWDDTVAELFKKIQPEE